MGESEALTILVVDDDPDILDLVVELLEGHDYRVVRARNGKEALERVRQARPHGMILDLMMPVLDGRAVARTLRSDPDTAGLPILLLSADRNLEDEAQNLGAAGWLAKPFDLDELVDGLRRAIGEKE